MCWSHLVCVQFLCAIPKGIIPYGLFFVGLCIQYGNKPFYAPWRKCIVHPVRLLSDVKKCVILSKGSLLCVWLISLDHSCKTSTLMRRRSKNISLYKGTMDVLTVSKARET
jgi:hypothetical protein